MKCPTCGNETEGRNHNGRGLRCTFCWALLPSEPPKPKLKRKRRPKPEPKLEAKPAEVKAGE